MTRVRRLKLKLNGCMAQRKQGSIGQVFPQEIRAVVSAVVVVVVSVAVPSSAGIARYKRPEII